MLPRDSINAFADQRAWMNSKRWLLVSLAALGALFVLGLTRERLPGATRANSLVEDNLDRRLQQAAVTALGDRRGTIIVMDPQTGRIRAVVNPDIAFNQNFSPGSTIKPFTALTAFRAGLIDDETRTLCREEYAHDDFHTVCSHPRDLSPLNPTEAIAYSCNYYFGRVGERLKQDSFMATLAEFGFGRKTGITKEEAQGKLLRGKWRSEHAIGEDENVRVTPIQLLNAYVALVNGGRLFTPRVAPARDFKSDVQSNVQINDGQRALIIAGMRGAVRYGTAEPAHLYSLPSYIFGKTGTADQLSGFRTQGWFVSFAGEADPSTAAVSPTAIKLAVLVFLDKAHGSDAAEIARPIYQEFARSGDDHATASETVAAIQTQPRTAESSKVRVHVVSQNSTELLSIEDYVRGVVATEGSTEDEIEALKALAIASRTYTIKNLRRHDHEGYDLCSTTHCQRYAPIEREALSDLIVEAVRSTEGEILKDDANQPVNAFFSASCGGATADLGELWGGASPRYLRETRDEYCVSQNHSWTDVIRQADLLKAMQSDDRTNVGEHLHDVRVVRHDQSNRAALISISGDRQKQIRGWDFKIIVGRALGWNVLKSSRFEVSRSGKDFVFRGSGFGHGLGLCQAGAHVMAERGAGYRQILEKYFPGTRVDSVKGYASNADLFWSTSFSPLEPAPGTPIAAAKRQTLASEDLRINYPATISAVEIENLLKSLQLFRRNLESRISRAGLNVRIPRVEVFINETTGDFVGRTGQPPWAAGATKNFRIETQPLLTLKRRGILKTTLHHELVHTFVDALGRSATPRWLAEGLAIHLAGEGRMVARYAQRHHLSAEQIDVQLSTSKSADEMRSAYAAAYAEVKRLISNEGEAAVWKRVAR